GERAGCDADTAVALDHEALRRLVVLEVRRDDLFGVAARGDGRGSHELHEDLGMLVAVGKPQEISGVTPRALGRQDRGNALHRPILHMPMVPARGGLYRERYTATRKRGERWLLRRDRRRWRSSSASRPCE